MVITALVAVACAVGELSDLRVAAAAMACCAKTDYSCAGLRTPDECCQTMGHAPAHPVAATLAGQSTQPGAMVATLPPASQLLPVTLSTSLRLPESKRPHDPPHLHTFSLLV
jgi:hypothetical protein